MIILELEGREITTKEVFHDAIGQFFDIPYYGKNLDALWDVLTQEMPRPVTIIWKNAGLSKRSMGSDFDKIIEVFKQAHQHDIEINARLKRDPNKVFNYQLENDGEYQK